MICHSLLGCFLTTQPNLQPWTFLVASHLGIKSGTTLFSFFKISQGQFWSCQLQWQWLHQESDLILKNLCLNLALSFVAEVRWKLNKGLLYRWWGEEVCYLVLDLHFTIHCSICLYIFQLKCCLGNSGSYSPSILKLPCLKNTTLKKIDFALTFQPPKGWYAINVHKVHDKLTF